MLELVLLKVSRCGSTLLCRLLQEANPALVWIREPPALVTW